MKILQKLSILISAVIMTVIVPISVSAMSTQDFDNGMAKGIDYFNSGLYYEAKDEFQWFCDANWGNMNSGQQQYALDYLGGAKAKVIEVGLNTVTVRLTPGGKSLYGATYHIDKSTVLSVIKKIFGINAWYNGEGNTMVTYKGGGYTFIIHKWYNTPTVKANDIFGYIGK